MSTTFVGTRFDIRDPWGPQEHYIIDSIQRQVEEEFKDQTNLILSLTWFGPQFKNNEWQKVQELIANKQQFDNLFWLAPVDPLCILPDVFESIEQALHAKNIYYIGTGFNSKLEFNTGAVACLQEFPDYQLQEIQPTEFNYVYMCYNRKPKPHRIRLVNEIFKNNLQNCGILTLGANDVDYDVTEGMPLTHVLKIQDDPRTYTKQGKYNLYQNFGGVPYDLLSLGRLDLWQQHFLNVVSETEFREWDNRFVTEKTWKPVIGMRPFVINGQVKIYQWLRDNGFKTFNHYFPVDLEESVDNQVQTSIVDVIKFLAGLSNTELVGMYQDMLPDLEHNRTRFFEFAAEQENKINNLFKN